MKEPQLGLFAGQVGKSARILRGDCAELLRSIPDASIDAIVTDPPAGIGFMGKEWDKDKGGRDAWVAWLRDIMRECLRVMKPGGHALVWALPRTSHWTGYAIEDAGFEVRDRLCHLFGTGFPKSLDVSKAIDARLGKSGERPVVGKSARHVSSNPETQRTAGMHGSSTFAESPGMGAMVTAPATPEAARWSGWGTALKPACEDWWLARKPLIGTVAANVMAHGTGALNVDGCRIGTESTRRISNAGTNGEGWGMGKASHVNGSDAGRWPAHVVLDEEAARMLDAQSGVLHARGNVAQSYGGGGTGDSVTIGARHLSQHHDRPELKEDGGASRFFYVAKPSTREKTSAGTIDNKHPTVKSIALMRWLVRLITPPCGTVLDPFLGSGTTGVACAEEGFSFVGIEREAEHFETARQRIELAYGTVDSVIP